MLKVELLDETHDRGGFDCGVEPLNRYIQQIARQHIAKGISKTFVLVDERSAAPKPVLGFFTISLCQVLGQQVPSKWTKKLPEQIPAMRLGRLAVAHTQQGGGKGKALLVEALHRIARVAELAEWDGGDSHGDSSKRRWQKHAERAAECDFAVMVPCVGYPLWALARGGSFFACVWGALVPEELSEPALQQGI